MVQISYILGELNTLIYCCGVCACLSNEYHRTCVNFCKLRSNFERIPHSWVVDGYHYGDMHGLRLPSFSDSPVTPTNSSKPKTWSYFKKNSTRWVENSNIIVSCIQRQRKIVWHPSFRSHKNQVSQTPGPRNAGPAPALSPPHRLRQKRSPLDKIRAAIAKQLQSKKHNHWADEFPS